MSTVSGCLSAMTMSPISNCPQSFTVVRSPGLSGDMTLSSELSVTSASEDVTAEGPCCWSELGSVSVKATWSSFDISLPGMWSSGSEMIRSVRLSKILSISWLSVEAASSGSVMMRSMSVSLLTISWLSMEDAFLGSEMKRSMWLSLLSTS